MSKYDNAGLVMIPSGYKASKVYSVIPNTADGDFDFARASTATRVNKDGLIESVATGTPRLDYPLIDGVVQDCPALLLEPSRTNLITYSEDFAQPAWSKVNATIELNSTISPDGTLNASKIIDDATNGYHRITDAFTTPSSGNFTYSIFLKKGTLTTAQFQVFDGATAASAFVDLENGTIKSDGQGINHKIENYGNGWYRCSVSGVYGGSTTTVYIYTKQKTPDYIGSGDYLYIWGAQLEQGSYPTSYIPTSGATVTRLAETCNGAGNASTFNDSEGVLMAEISDFDNDSYRQLTISSGSNSNAIAIMNTTTENQVVCFVNNGGVTQASISTILNSTHEFNKIAIKYKLNDFSVYINGFEIGVDTNGTLPSGLNTLNFDNGAGNGDVYGNVKQLMLFNTALTDSELEDLTSWDSFNEMTTAQLYTIS